MRFPYKLILPILILFLASLACSLPLTPSATPVDVESAAATAAAGTLTALAPTPPEPQTPSPTTPDPDVTETGVSVPTETTIPLPPALRVAFTDRSRNLWVWQEGTAPLKIINSGNVQDVNLTEDGQWIAFTRTSADFSETSLWAIAFDGSNEHLLVSASDFLSMPLHPDIDPDSIVSIYPVFLQFIPHSHILAFMTAPQFEGPGFFDNKDLWLVDVVTGTQTNLLPAGSGGQYTYSPDGSQIALVTPTEISLINADGSNRRSSVLTYPFVLTYSEFSYHAMPVWSSDGSFLRVSIPYSDSLGDPSQPVTLYQIPTDGSPGFVIGNVHTAPIQNASYSPDLSKIAFNQQIGLPADNTYSIQIAAYDGTASAEVANGSINFAGWAPDSSHYSYHQWEPRNLYLAQAGVSGGTLVDRSPVDDWQWISSERMLFIYIGSPEWQLCLTGLDGISTLIANLGSGDGFIRYDFTGN